MSTTRTTLNKRMRLIESAADLVTAAVKTNNCGLSKLATQNVTNSFPDHHHHLLASSPGSSQSTATSSQADVDDSDDFMQTGFCEASHPNTIIHIDIDCFYAQVEEIREPSLRHKPLGIQQKNCLVTCNYKAREYGIRKLMSVAEAQKLCPEMVLVNGEDLNPYRQMSSRVFEHITKKYPSVNVERLGMDENFVDVTRIIEERMEQEEEEAAVSGCIYPANLSPPFATNCLCGCDRRLAIGTHLANDLRESLFKELGITTCAGIAHNKMLAKLAGALNKPNNQTVCVPTRCRDLMVQLKDLRSIPGIGQKTESLLREMNVDDIEALQRADQKSLVLKFGPEMAKKLKDWSHGVDHSPVRPSNFRPKSIGLEDSCRRPISVRQDIEDKFRALLQRLLNQVADDGRIPVAIKMTLRKFDAVKKTSHRETKQANILPTLFQFATLPTSGGDSITHRLAIVAGGQEKLLQLIMRLFERVIDLRLPFNVTLIGLAFSKFQERKMGSASIANYLMKKKDIEVQSVTSLTSDGLSPAQLPSPVAQFHGIGRFYRDRDMETMSDTMSIASDVSEPSEIVEPSPKKSRFGLNLMAKRRCLQASEPMDCASPSKLRVAELRLNSVDRERGEVMGGVAAPNLPPVAQMETQSTLSASASSSSSGMGVAVANHPIGDGKLVMPKCVDPEVFKELPSDVQNELIASWAAATTISTATVATAAGNGAASGIGGSTRSASILAANKANTLHRYFITNK